MKINKVMYLCLALICLILLSNCYGSTLPKNYIAVEDVKVYNESMEELDTVLLQNYEVDTYLNNLYNGLRPINSAAPTELLRGFTITTELKITVEFICSVSNNYDILKFDLKCYGTDDEIKSTSIEKVDDKYVVTYVIEDIPNTNSIYRPLYPKITDQNGNVSNASVIPGTKEKRTYFEGIVLRIDETYKAYKEDISNLNNNISTELKLFDKANDIVYQLLNDKENSLFDNNYVHIWYKHKYDIDESIFRDESYLFCQITYYNLINSLYSSSVFNYISTIHIGDPKDSVFGLTVNNTLSEIEEVMIDNGFVRSGTYEGDRFYNYSYKSPSGAYSIVYLYSILNNRVLAIEIQANDLGI